MQRSFKPIYQRLAKSLATLLLLLTAGLLGNAAHAQQSELKADPDNQKQVQRGQLVYKRFCSLCHGMNLEGQPNWRKRKTDGKLPAPPHDETGHTWHHPDDVLFGMIPRLALAGTCRHETTLNSL